MKIDDDKAVPTITRLTWNGDDKRAATLGEARDDMGPDFGSARLTPLPFTQLAKVFGSREVFSQRYTVS